MIVAEQASSDWIEWSGGECPVLSSVPVSIRVRANADDGGESGFSKADWWNWAHGRWPSSSDIIAYRLVSA
jgi:hypothetical protein